MKIARGLFMGLITAIGSSMVIIGAVLLAITEGAAMALPTLQPPPTEEWIIETQRPTTPNSQNVQPSPIIKLTTVQYVRCNYPRMWLPYQVKLGDQLEGVAKLFNIPVDQLRTANCLSSNTLLPDTILYIPPPTPTPTPAPTRQATQTEKPSQPESSRTATKTQTPCSHPRSWIPYTIKFGDTLRSIASRYNTNYQELQRGNCMGNSTTIKIGDTLFVPNFPTQSPTCTNAPTHLPPTVEPTIIPTKTITNTLQLSLTPTPTSTHLPTSTFTPTPTRTKWTITRTSTPTLTSTRTSTPSPTNTHTPTITATKTFTPTPSGTLSKNATLQEN